MEDADESIRSAADSQLSVRGGLTDGASSGSRSGDRRNPLGDELQGHLPLPQDQQHVIRTLGRDVMSTPTEGSAIEIRIRGRVQGVGFRPTAWRVARELGLAGEVLNDGEGVLLRISGDSAKAAALLDGIRLKLPPLARIDEVESKRYDGKI